MKQLSYLLPYLPAYEIVGELEPATVITEITNDSRQVRPGALFIAYRGRNIDLHRFLPDAAEAGAVAVVVERPWGSDLGAGLITLPQVVVPDGREAWAWLSAAWEEHPSRSLRVIGVTGTDGKTTTLNLIAVILDALGMPYGMISTLGARIGVREVETGEHVTTPDAPIIQRFLREMVEAGISVALVETTSHALAQHRVTGVNYDIAVVTNITHEHLDEHGSLEAYRAAKRSLFERLCDSYRKPDTPKVAILNADDSSYSYLSPIQADIQLSYG
ncbi:MAG: Mur ligase family protein, partial [Ardenticatenaceae bacterium]